MLKATVTQERNGIYIFEGEILTDSPLFPLALENYIIKADADHLLKDQRFRIKRIVPNHNGKAEIYAEHVSYLSRELTIKPEVSITGSAQVALSQWKASIVEANPFVVDSDIPTSNKTKWRIDKVENPRMALGGVAGSILDVWGGEYRFDNYHISLLQKRGTTAKTVLAYGRNITDFEQERNIANTYTSIAPYAIYTDDKEREIVVHVDGYVVDSQHVNKYPNRVTLPVDFSSEFGHDEVPTKARLLALANQYIKANEIGVPSTSIKVSFVDLSKSADYAEYAFLEQVNLCDDVRVYYPKLGVNTVAKVIRTVWNVLTESYDEIEIGQKRMSLVGQMQEQQKAIKEISTQVNYAITSADGNNTVFYGLYGENGLGEPTATKVGDTWYKPNGTSEDMLVWTGTIWKVVLDADTFRQIGVKIDEMEQEVQTAIDQSNTAINNANQAIADAGFAKNQANTAASLAGQAVADANTAITDAKSALDAYNNLSYENRNLWLSSGASFNFGLTWALAKLTPQTRWYVSDYIAINSGDIYTRSSLKGVNNQYFLFNKDKTYISSEFGTLADTFKIPQDGSLLTNKPASGIPEDKAPKFMRLTFILPEGVTPEESKIKIEKGSKATPWSAAPEDVQVQISDINGELSRKVSQQTFDTLQGTVNTQSTQINQNKADIQARATKTEVNTLTGTVNSLDSQLKLEAGKISALNTKTDGHTTQIGSLQSSFSGLNSLVTEVEKSVSSWYKEYLTNTANPKEITNIDGSPLIDIYTYEITGKIVNNTSTPTKILARLTPKLEVGAGGGWSLEIIDSGGEISNHIKIYLSEVGKPMVSLWNHIGHYPVGLTVSRFIGRVTMFSSLEQTVQGFNTIVQGKADKTQVTQLEGQWSTTTALANGHTSQIASLGSDIALRLTKNQVTAEILSDKSVKDTRNDNQTPQWYFSNYPKQMAKELKNRTVIGLTQATGTYVLLETDVRWNDASGGNIEQTAKADDGVYQRRGNSTTWTAWAKVADTSNILTQINLSPEGVLIAGKNIWLDGNTKISDAVIKTAHIADLAVSGAKIANASIASAKIISLDASKISVGTLTGHTINGAYINGGSITGTSFFNSGADGNMSIANGRIRAKDFFVEAEGSLTSLTSYVVVRSNENHVFLQPSDGYEVAVTKVRTAGGVGNYLAIRASHFRGGNTNATFESMNGYSVLRSSGDTQPVYLQGNEIRATKVSSAGSYVAVRASAFPTGSLEVFKTNIRKRQSSALSIIRNSDIYEYNLKSELESGEQKTRIGLVIGSGYNTPSEIIDGDGVEQYAMNSLAWKAIQELDLKNTKINNEISRIKGNHANDIWQLKNEIQELKNEIQELRQSA
nr:phage tail spike protein [Enterococcus alcedinis]